DALLRCKLYLPPSLHQDTGEGPRRSKQGLHRAVDPRHLSSLFARSSVQPPQPTSRGARSGDRSRTKLPSPPQSDHSRASETPGFERDRFEDPHSQLESTRPPQRVEAAVVHVRVAGTVDPTPGGRPALGVTPYSRKCRGDRGRESLVESTSGRWMTSWDRKRGPQGVPQACRIFLCLVFPASQ